ncbi:MAG: hypothetical protein V1869_01290 [Candidatus Omnitrophota bacterium]
MLILINLAVILNSVILAKNLFKAKGAGDFVLVAFILFFSQIILVELILGSLGLFYFPYIFLANIFILGLTALAYRRKPLSFPVKVDIGPFIGNNLVLLALAVFGSFFLVKSFINLINPPISPDSLQYHLAFPATWIRNGNLANPICIFGSMPMAIPNALETSATSFYPINAQLFFAWLMLPLRNAFLADLGEFPFYIIGIITVYMILRKFGVKKEMALLSGFLWALIPNIFKQLRTASQIDLICAVMFLLMVYAILLFKEEPGMKRAVLFGISAGIFLGTKVINIVWFIAALPFLLYVFYRSSRALKFGAVKITLMSGSIISMVFLFGGFAYIRNFIFTGNPFFPVDLKIFGVTVFKGLLDSASYKASIASGDQFNLARILFKEGLGVQFLGLILPGILIPFIFYNQIRKKAKPLGGYLLFLITPFLIIALHVIFVNIYVVRYLFPFLSIGLVCAVIFINLIERKERYFYFIAFVCILASASELAHRGELIVSVALAAVLFATMLLFKKQLVSFYRGRVFNKALAVFLILGLFSLGYLNVLYNKVEFERYPLTFSKKEAWQADIARGWQKLNELTDPGARVAYTGRQEFYPLFGSGLKNHVKYVSVNEKEVAPYNKFDGSFRRLKDGSCWGKNLKKDKIEYLFVAQPYLDNRESPDPEAFPIEDEWAKASPGNFKLLYSNSMVHIYRVSLSGG